MTDEPLDPQARQARHDLIAAHLEGPVAKEPWVRMLDEPRDQVRARHAELDSDAFLEMEREAVKVSLANLRTFPWIADREEAGRLKLHGAHFSIGPDGDVYLVGRVQLEHLDVAELDRIIGVLYELVERWFQPAIRIGFAKS